MHNFLEALRTQRWDDHRYYHHSRINQSLHLLSAFSFLAAYVLLFINPAAAALVAWLVAMVSRQSGHFFFEPKGYDAVNHATHEHKEEIKVGYNLKRKIILHAVWALSPAILWIQPTVWGLFPPITSLEVAIYQVGEIWLWVGISALLFRTVHLFFLRDVQTGLVWITKIVTDPFQDIKTYWKAPLHLMRGELIDPMHAAHRAPEEFQPARDAG
jgi:uncharacterized membrane protein HdeD (DUF308 family)